VIFGRYGLKAKLAAGAVILNCASALVFGDLRMDTSIQVQPQSPTIVSQAAGTDDFATIGCVQVPGPFVCQGNPLDWEQQESTQVVPAPACIYADAAGVPGEGCGVSPLSSNSPTIKTEDSCVHADEFGVPGEGCGPLKTDTAKKLLDLWGVLA
jgi:hypothetical protein